MSENYVKTILSNRLDRLADALSEQLFVPGASAFERRYVFVPQEQIKEFLHGYLASKLGIAAGMQICCLEQGLAELVENVPSSPLELSLFIEEQIHLCLASDALRSDSAFTPLYEYIEGEGLNDRRILTLSDQLARLFIRYGLYGDVFLSEWLSAQGWQQRLWQRVFSQGRAISIDRLLKSKVESVSVHLFGFSYLPAAYLSFFARCRLKLYLFSPCASYWDDLCSDKEKLSIERQLQSRKANSRVCEEMQGYLQDQHPLLANWGKWGREFLKCLDGYSLDVAERYEPSPKSLLGSIKNSMLFLELLAATDSDRSIQVHSAPSKLREVEVLKDVISTLLARHASEPTPLTPKEVLVLAPDIAEYAPYIHMVFGASPYAYRIEGLEQGSTSDFCQAFYHFLSFFEEDFSLVSFLKLLYSHAFRKRWKFSLEDAHLIRSWLESAQVRTGEKSWQEGIDRLLFGLALSSDNGAVYPVNCIGQSDVELFNRFLVCYHSLKRDIQEMRTQTRKTLCGWLTWIREAALCHCECDPENEPFFRDLERVLHHSSLIPSRCFSFISVQRILRQFYEKRSGFIPAAHLQHIRFCSMHPGAGAGRPYRIIYALGLDEEHFPRFEPSISLCALSKSLKKPYLPSKGDEDRYLFLELLCSAQDYFILSYERINAQDNKSQGPSYLIEELQAFAGVILMHIDHPFLSFDAMYFAEDAPVCNLSHGDFLLAESHYGAEPRTRRFFSGSAAEGVPDLVRTSSLRALAKDPIKFYFNQALGMYLQEEETRGEERFCLPGLKKYALKKASLKADLCKVIYDSERQGILPEGMFKQAAVQALSSEIEIRDESLKSLKVEGVFSVELSVHCRAPVRLDNGNWIVPALCCALPGKEAFPILGTLSDITDGGYLSYGKKDTETLLSEWPLYLLFLNVRHWIGDPPAKMLFAKDGKECAMPLDNSLEPLLDYLAYYLRARTALSPLKTQWASSLLLKTEKDFEKAVHATLQSQEGFYKDPYIEWMKKSQIAIEPSEMYAAWADDLKRHFKSLLFYLDAAHA